MVRRPLSRARWIALVGLLAVGCGEGDGGAADAGGTPDAGGTRDALVAYPDASLDDAGLVTGAYFVAPGGDDDAPGTIDQPWLTLGHAAATLVAGETVYVREGTYHERLVPGNDGTAQAPITFAAYPGEAAAVDGTGVTIPDGWGGLVEVRERAHVRIVGLRVLHAGTDLNHAGILVDHSSHVTVQGCYTYDTVSSGIGVWSSDNVVVDGNEVELACNDGEQECITVAITDGFQVSRNHVHDTGPGSNGGEGIDVKDGSSNGVVFGNVVHDTHRLGIYVDAWDAHTFNVEVFGNLAYRCGGSGFAVAAENGGLLQDVWLVNNVATQNLHSGVVVGGWGVDGVAHPISGVYIVNNTLYANGTDGWGPGIVLENPEADDVVIRNNVLASNGYEQLAVDAIGAGLVVTHNLFFGDGAPYGTDYQLGDPLVEDAANHDFRLTSGSPAIDHGTTTDAPADDYAGVSRPQGAGVDIGAHERVP